MRFVTLTDVPDLNEAMHFCEINEHMEFTNGHLFKFCMADVAEPGMMYSLRIPPLSVNSIRSFAKTVFMEVFDFKRLCELLNCSKIGNICIFCEDNIFGPGNLISDQWQLSKSGRGGVVVGQKDDGENGLPLDQYVPAEGVIGKYGEPIEEYHPYYQNEKTPIRKIDCFTIYNPCMIDRTIYKLGFKSKAAVLQLVLPSEAMPGEKPLLSIAWGAYIW